MARIIVMRDAATDRENAIVLDERTAPDQLRSGDEAARLIERLGWAMHDADAPSRRMTAR